MNEWSNFIKDDEYEEINSCRRRNYRSWRDMDR